MIRTVTYLGILALATPAFAQDPAPAGAPDMSKAGPWTRQVKNPDKKGVDELFKAMEEAWKKGDVEAVADLVDFPVIMLTDDSKGEAKQTLATRQQWVAMMKSMANMPKDQMPKVKHKQEITFLSNTLAVAIEDTSVSGKMKGKWKSMSVLTQRDGKWKVKEMAQAGWGDVTPAQTAAEKAHQPANTLPPAPAR